jgi:hypothetical protein
MKQNLEHNNFISAIGQYWFAPTKQDNALFRVLMEV